MNATQVGNLIKSGLLAVGVSSSVLGYVSAEAWMAVGGAVLAVGAVVWQVISTKTAKLISTVAASDDVIKVETTQAIANADPSPKVVPSDLGGYSR